MYHSKSSRSCPTFAQVSHMQAFFKCHVQIMQNTVAFLLKVCVGLLLCMPEMNSNSIKAINAMLLIKLHQLLSLIILDCASLYKPIIYRRIHPAQTRCETTDTTYTAKHHLICWYQSTKPVSANPMIYQHICILFEMVWREDKWKHQTFRFFERKVDFKSQR